MSSRKNIFKYQTITSGDMSLASITSSVTNIQHFDNIGVQLIWSGSPTGSFSIQVSIDYARDLEGNVTNTGHWSEITLSPTPDTSLTSPIYIDLNQLSAPWIRVVYTKSSGTGTLNAWVMGKVL